MHSCIYEGTVSHRRHEPVVHEFQYRLFMLYLDLEELPLLVGSRGLIGSSRFAGSSFLRSDHLFNAEQPLATEIRQIVQHQTGRAPTGRIRLLTQLRYCGYYFSPLNLFYIYDQRDEQPEFVVAEVNNTPWKERHCYVLWQGNRVGAHGSMQFSHAKQFHVSPFMDMDMQYGWRVGQPDSQLNIHLSNFQALKKRFDADMSLHRRDLNERQLRRMTLRYPLMTAQISAAIYFQALKLWWKKCPSYTHPKKPNGQRTPVELRLQHRQTAPLAAR